MSAAGSTTLAEQPSSGSKQAAASVQPPDEKAPPRFGVLELEARTLTDKLARVVELREPWSGGGGAARGGGRR